MTIPSVDFMVKKYGIAETKINCDCSFTQCQNKSRCKSRSNFLRCSNIAFNYRATFIIHDKTTEHLNKGSLKTQLEITESRIIWELNGNWQSEMHHIEELLNDRMINETDVER